MFLRFLKALHIIEMYSYNSIHKVIAVFLVVAWAIWQFSERNTDDLHYENGQIIRSGNSVNGLKEGVWRWYYEDGSVNIKGYFENGDREGKWITYNGKGDIIQERNYKNDKLNGPLTVYNTEGERIKEILYVDNEKKEEQNFQEKE